MKNNLNIYAILSHLRPLKKTYQGKIMVVAFLGTHVPLLALLSYFIIVTSLDFETALRVLGVALLATLAGTAVTIYALYTLLAPIRLTHASLREYLNSRTLPDLPTQYTDEAGILMADTQHAVRKLDQVIEHLESYDELTTLPNRILFTDRLEHSLQLSRRTSQPVAVLSLGLDGFQRINTAFGQSVGDQLLKAVAQRLSVSVRETDVLSRLSGDVFAVLQHNVVAASDITTQAERMLESFKHPFYIENKEIHITASIGITVYPTDDNRSDTLIGNAEAAMHLAKRTERGAFQFYAADMNDKLRERLSLEADLREALERDEFVLYYQPQLDVEIRKIVGVEALVRWQHPVRGFVSPADFIPALEESGLIVPIGKWILKTACLQAREWQTNGFPSMRMAVNLSARQFQQPDLYETVKDILAETQIEPGCLELEITESLLMENIEETISIIERLRNLKIAISLDDFGTGYSSLSYLHRFPINTLKIDQAFVRSITPEDSESGAIAATIITLAQSLKLSVIAEGVETEAQYEFLKTQGCEQAQGFLFSRPVPAPKIQELLTNSQALHSSEMLAV